MLKQGYADREQIIVLLIIKTLNCNGNVLRCYVVTQSSPKIDINESYSSDGRWIKTTVQKID